MLSKSWEKYTKSKNMTPRITLTGSCAVLNMALLREFKQDYKYVDVFVNESRKEIEFWFSVNKPVGSLKLKDVSSLKGICFIGIMSEYGFIRDRFRRSLESRRFVANYVRSDLKPRLMGVWSIQL